MPVPKGQRYGGRQKGTPNKATAAKAAEVEASGLTPLDYMLQVMREASDPKDRFEAAKAAAPYVHPKRAPVDSDGTTQPGAVIYVDTTRTVPR